MAKKEIKLSATRISTFLQCLQKYWFQYHDHLPKVASPAFRLGIAVHESLELAGNIWVEKDKFTKADKKKIIDKYVETSVKEGIEDMSVHREGIELVTQRLNNFRLGKKIIGLETTFGYDKEGSLEIITKEGVKLIGAIDKAIESDKDTLLIVDYKTSKTAPTADQLRYDVQLSIYDLVATMIWPDYKRIILSLDMLRSEVLYTYRTQEEREDFVEYLKIIHTQMIKLKKNKAKARLNIFCPWCDYKEYCAEYDKACKKSDYKFLATHSLPDDKLVSEWQSVRSIKKILETRDRELAMIIMEKIRETNANMMSEHDEVYIRQNSRKTYDLNTVHSVVSPEAFVKMVNLNKKSVDKYLSSNPAVMDVIKKDLRVNYTSPFLAIKKAKVKKGR